MAATDQQNILQQYQGTYQNPNFGGGPMPFNYKPPTAQQPQVMTGRAPWLPKPVPAEYSPAPLPPPTAAPAAAAAPTEEPWYAKQMAQAQQLAAPAEAAPAAKPAAPKDSCANPQTNQMWYACRRPDLFAESFYGSEGQNAWADALRADPSLAGAEERGEWEKLAPYATYIHPRYGIGRSGGSD